MTPGSDEKRRPFRRRKRHKSQGMKSLAELVPGAMPKNQPAHAKLARLIALWERSVPPRVAREVTPVRYRDGTLHLHARAAVWAQEVSLLSTRLIEHMRSRDPRMPVTKLAPRVGPMPERVPVEPEPPPRGVVPIDPAKLPEEIRVALAKVEDAQLRKSLMDAACAALAIKH